MSHLAMSHIAYVFHWANFWSKCGGSRVKVDGQRSKWTTRLTISIFRSRQIDIMSIMLYFKLFCWKPEDRPVSSHLTVHLICRIRALVNVQVSFQVNGQKGNYGQSILWIIQFRTRSEIVCNCPRRSSVQLWNTLLNWKSDRHTFFLWGHWI